MRLRILVAALILSISPAWAQSTLLQGGPVSAGHVPMYVNSGNSQPVVQDSGTAAGGGAGVGLSELTMAVRSTGTPPYADAGNGPNGENFCNYDGPITAAGGYHYLCMSPNAQGGGLISYGAQGAASTLPLQFMVNGELQSLATVGTVVAGAVTCFDDTSDAIIACPDQPETMAYQAADDVAITGGSVDNVTIDGAAITNSSITLSAPLPVGSGGTGVTSYGALSTAMGLGTMSIQNASGVAITGGTITGLPSPSAASDATTKAYVDGVATGLFPLAASRLITITTLPANTYSNGASGVGATLTANSNGALSIDSVAVANGNVVIINNEATAANNGIYTVTALGSGGAPYVLTRATYFDTAAEMLKNSYSAVTAGSTQVGTAWILAATTTTVGTTAVNFNLFQSSALNSLADGKIFVGSAGGVATAQTMSGDCTLINTGAITCLSTNSVAFAASATTNALNASNISSGTLPAARLPNPSASTLGGVQSYAAVSNQFLTTISTSGVPASAQPGFSDLSGTAGPTQGGTGLTTYSTGDTLYASGSNTLAKRSIGSTGQVLTVAGGVPTWATPSTAGSDIQTFTTAGTDTWEKPSSGSVAFAQCWAGGGSGARDSADNAGGGGGGGAYAERLMYLSDLSSTVTVTVGAGGASRTTNNTAGATGGNSSFGAFLVAYGGAGGGILTSTAGGGGGGGSLSVGTVGGLDGGNGGTDMLGVGATGGSGAVGEASAVNGGGGGGGGNASGTGGAGGAAVNGGGGGGGGGDTGFLGGAGGRAWYGGGGGGGSDRGTDDATSGAGGLSQYSGAGGKGSAGNTAATAGSAPSGGGGGAETGNSGAGGRGQCIVTSW